MKRLHLFIPLLLFITMCVLGVILYDRMKADTFEEQQVKLAQGKIRDVNIAKQKKISALERFFSKYKSPLYPYAKHIVEEAEANGIDHRLLPAIAMNESTLCKAIPHNSYNCWGWGIYADKVTRFGSYGDAISTITAGLKKYYYDRGMASPSAIMQAYTPNSPDGIWAKKIHRWFDEIDSVR